MNVILPEAYTVRTCGDTLVAGEHLIEDDPELALRFLRATLRGRQWVIENPDEAGALGLKYHPTLDQGLPAEAIEVEQVYTLEFLHTIYDEEG